MNKNTKRILAVVGASALAIGALVSTSAQAASTSVSLVFQGPLSGGEALAGQDELLGTLTALQMYNDSNPAVKVTLVKADDQGDPSVAGPVSQGIATNKNVVGIIGSAYSGATIASFPAYKAAAIPMVSQSATRVTLTDPKAADNGFPIFHRVVPPDSLQGTSLVKWATEGVTSPKVYVLDDLQTYSTGLVQYMAPQLKAQGITPVAYSHQPKGTTDYTSEVSKIKSSGANVVIYAGYYPEAGALAKALKDGGYKGVLASGDGTVNAGFITGAGAAAAEGVRLTAPDLPFSLVANAAQKAAYTKATGEAISKADSHTYVVSSFDATNVFLTCIKAGKLTRPAIQNCINQGSFDTMSGVKIKFSRYGDVVGGAPIGGFLVSGGVITYKGAK
jgi:branched-chain amino acid transport system substrate-binding protein